MPQANDAEPGRASAFRRLLCWLDRHEPVGHRADWNGETYVSRCEHCRVPIKRLRKSTWRRTD